MKSITQLIYILLISMSASAQSEKNIFFDNAIQTNKFHSIDELQNLRKGDLISLYQERVIEIFTILPYISLTNQPEVSLADVGIKEDSRNLKILNKNHYDISEALKTTKEMIGELVPYADTDKIILSILYYEEIIKKIRMGINSTY